MLQEIAIEDKILIEQVKMLQQLEAEEKIVFKMVVPFLTKKIKEFFPKNVAAI